MTTDGLDPARALLPGRRLAPLELLGGSDRSVVRRVSTGPETLIVKEFTGAGEGWVRESAALSVLSVRPALAPALAPAPRLIAAGDAPPIVVMSDAGGGPSVADALLGSDPVAAADAVLAWAAAVAGLHRATVVARQPFQAELAARSGDLPVAESTVPSELDDAAASIIRHAGDLGVDVPAGALDELRGLADRLGPDRSPGSAALTPADTCPDNNVMTASGLVLIDFEGAQWRHIAWDVAYLAVPWPSCWCAWRIPDGVAELAMARYRGLSTSSYVDSDEFGRDVVAASVGWAFVSASYFLPRALLDDAPPADPTKRAPRRRALIQHRLGRAREQAELPALAELAGRLCDELAVRWGDVPLALAPAFA